MEKIAIIVPMYNVEQYVEKCLNSLIKQTYKDIEIYAISDGSPDNSINIARKIGKKDKRIVCIEKENGGYGSVLEYAIKTIKCKYMLVCDPDDWLDENAVQELYNYAKIGDYDIVVADKYDVLFDTKEATYSSAVSNIISVDYKNESNPDKFAFLACSPHSKLFKTSILKKIKFEHKVNYTDFTLFIMSLVYSSKVGYLQKPLSYYLLDRPGNSTTDKTKKAVKSHIIVWFSTYNQINNHDCSKHKYLVYRLFIEFKTIVSLYLQIGKNDDSDLYNDLKKIRKILIENKNNLRISEISFKRKFDIKLAMCKLISFRFYLFINKVVKKV